MTTGKEDKTTSMEKEPEKVEDEKEIIEEKKIEKHVDLLTLEDIRENCLLIEKAVYTRDLIFMSRVIRSLPFTKKKLNNQVIYYLVHGMFTSRPSSLIGQVLFKLINKPTENTDVEMTSVHPSSFTYRTKSSKGSTDQQTKLLPEVEIYIHLLVLLYLTKENELKRACICADDLIEKISDLNRRTTDRLSAKVYFYYSRAHELSGSLDKIRAQLHKLLRTCTLRNDYEGQAVLINLLLRNYLNFNLYDQADKLILKTTFPETASNNEWARYCYYQGRIKAVQLDYTDAHDKLQHALRKAGHQSALGFKQMVQKLAIVVELLLGDIPDRSLFREPSMRKTLQPYFWLTQAVRSGNINRFNEVLSSYQTKFSQEHTFMLNVRLRHNVIKTGVRTISLSYSRISLVDIAKKLQLGSPEDAEYIVAKAIRDGVIEAVIDHSGGFMQSLEKTDLYRTTEPMDAFHQRIMVCLDIRNQSVKAMRYKNKKYGDELESAEERREREKEELEAAKELADEGDDFDGF